MRPGPVRLRDSDPLRRRADVIIAGLRAERIRQGLSQRQLSERLGFSQMSVCTWECRRFDPAAQSVRSWCEVLGVRVPPDVEIAFRPLVPRCPSRPAYERHRRRREACTTCREWFNEHRRLLRVAKRNAA